MYIAFSLQWLVLLASGRMGFATHRQEDENKNAESAKDTYTQDVAECIKDDKNYLWIFGAEQWAQWCQAVLLQAIANLSHTSSRRQVGDGPHSLLLTLEITLQKYTALLALQNTCKN